jgi:hypothetical protein
VIVSAPGITDNEIVTDLDCDGLSASVTIAVKLTDPLAVGVPEIRPVPEVRLRPAGKLPDEIDHM